MTQTIVTTQQRSPAVGGASLQHPTLAQEHARLLQGVKQRTSSVLALLDARVWPQREVATLTEYLRSAVLRQASDTETLLLPNGARSTPVAELSADHARLYTLTARLGKVQAEHCSLPELRQLVSDLLATLRRHLADELAVLAALADAGAAVPGTGTLRATGRPWLPDGDAPVLITLDDLPARTSVQMCIERLLRLRVRQRAEVIARDAGRLREVSTWLNEFTPSATGCSAPPTATAAHGWTSPAADHHSETRMSDPITRP